MMDPLAPDALFQRNRAAFRRYYPQVWAGLEAISKTVSTPVFEDGVAVNIDLGEVRLYPDAAPDWAAHQLDDYFRNPDRLGFDSPAHCNISPVSAGVLRDIAVFCRDNEGYKVAPYPVVDVGFTFVFGIGLGYHVAEIVRRGLAKHVVLAEPVPEFLLHSLSAVDWRKIFRDARRKKIYLHFLVGHDPQRTIESIELLIRRVGSTFLDGSYAYLHYYSWPLKEARQLLNEKIKVFYLSSGFFEDEILMMRNTYGNLRQWSFGIVDRRPRLEQSLPVFVVGSGPSLDRDIETIRRWSDRAIIFSCGTSLGILLKNGIRPHLHVENENTYPLVKNLRLFRDEYGFEGIRLVATSTLQSEASGLFDKRWFYYRAPLSSSTLLSGGTEPLPHADPLVSNAAAAASAYLGFRNLYLFGVDCGRPFEGEHHAKDAIYYQDSFEIDPNDRPDAGFERVVPGNFGGKVLTSWSLDLSRRSMTALIQSLRLTVYNCSHGARIDGARPKVGSAIDLDDPPGRQQAVLARIEETLPRFGPGELLESIELKPHAEACAGFREAFTRLVEDARAEDRGFWDFEQRIERFWNEDWSEYKGVLKIIGGTYASMVRLGAYAGTRIKNRRLRREFFDFFLDRYLETCLWMTGETEIMLSEMAEGREEITDVGHRKIEGVPESEPETGTVPESV